MAKPLRRSRLVPRREAGISNVIAPFWLGQRAEHVIGARTIMYADEKEAKAEARRSKRGVSATGTRTRKPRSPNAQLNRLERNLARRKTLAARQRIEQQIKALRAQLEAKPC